MSELAGLVAMVTGGAQGLGAATAETFVREGATVIVLDLKEEAGHEVARRVGGQFIPLDVTDGTRWAAAVSNVLGLYGRIDVLVNNAGVAGVMPFSETSPRRWESQLDVMQTGPYLGMRAVLPAMVEAGAGAIVNVASINAIRGRAASAAYTTAKHGLLGLTRSVALEYASSGIRVNAVCPGGMRTPMLVEAIGDDIDSYGRRAPIGRLGEPGEIAEVISFLASPRASYCIGAAITVDGGVTVGFP